jgi:hypothetical protein
MLKSGNLGVLNVLTRVLLELLPVLFEYPCCRSRFYSGIPVFCWRRARDSIWSCSWFCFGLASGFSMEWTHVFFWSCSRLYSGILVLSWSRSLFYFGVDPGFILESMPVLMGYPDFTLSVIPFSLLRCSRFYVGVASGFILELTPVFFWSCSRFYAGIPILSCS